MGSSVIRILRCALLQAEREQRVARADDDELAAVEQIRLLTIARVYAEASVPERFALQRVVGVEVAAAVVAEKQSACGTGRPHLAARPSVPLHRERICPLLLGC